jgi:hypothetical protein
VAPRRHAVASEGAVAGAAQGVEVVANVGVGGRTGGPEPNA